MRSLLLLALLASAPSALAAPRSFTVEVSGHGPPVILIPGLACGGGVWAPTVARYRQGHELHVLTLAGFDGQKPTAPPLLSSVRDVLARYIADKHLMRPVIVGHSLGGFVALWLAATTPERVGKLVIVDALPFLGAAEQPTATVESVRGQAEMMRDMLLKAPRESFVAQNRAAITTMVTDAKNVDPIAAMGRRSDQPAVVAAVYEMMTTDLRPLLPKIHAPTLVLAADDGPDAHKLFAAQYAGLAGVQIEVVEHARHFIFVDEPARFYRALDGVLGGGAK